jgi:hypothetical protein
VIEQQVATGTTANGSPLAAAAISINGARGHEPALGTVRSARRRHLHADRICAAGCG